MIEAEDDQKIMVTHAYNTLIIAIIGYKFRLHRKHENNSYLSSSVLTMILVR